MESAGITVKTRAGISPKLLFLRRLKARKSAESALPPRDESPRNRQSIDEPETGFANIMKLELRFCGCVFEWIRARKSEAVVSCTKADSCVRSRSLTQFADGRHGGDCAGYELGRATLIDSVGGIRLEELRVLATRFETVNEHRQLVVAW